MKHKHTKDRILHLPYIMIPQNTIRYYLPFKTLVRPYLVIVSLSSVVIIDLVKPIISGLSCSDYAF